MCPGFGIINNRVIAINSRVESPRRLLTLELRIEFITHIVCRILIVGHVLQPVYVVGVGVAALSIGGWGGGEDTWTLLLDCLLGRLPVNIMNPGSASYLMNGQRDRVYLLFAMQFAILFIETYPQLSMSKMVGVRHEVDPQDARFQIILVLHDAMGSNMRMTSLWKIFLYLQIKWKYCCHFLFSTHKFPIFGASIRTSSTRTSLYELIWKAKTKRHCCGNLFLFHSSFNYFTFVAFLSMSSPFQPLPPCPGDFAQLHFADKCANGKCIWDWQIVKAVYSVRMTHSAFVMPEHERRKEQGHRQELSRRIRERRIIKPPSGINSTQLNSTYWLTD